MMSDNDIRDIRDAVGALREAAGALKEAKDAHSRQIEAIFKQLREISVCPAQRHEDVIKVLDEQGNDIKELQANKNWVLGASAAISAIIVVIGMAIGWAISLISGK